MSVRTVDAVERSVHKTNEWLTGLARVPGAHGHSRHEGGEHG